MAASSSSSATYITCGRSINDVDDNEDDDDVTQLVSKKVMSMMMKW
jgi:hypothetical protein